MMSKLIKDGLEVKSENVGLLTPSREEILCTVLRIKECKDTHHAFMSAISQCI